MHKKIKINRDTYTMISIILFLIGVVIYAYPRLADFFYQEYTKVSVNSFKETVQRMQEQEDTQKGQDKKLIRSKQQEIQTLQVQGINTPLAKLLKKAEEYNKKLYEEGQKDLIDPFSYEVSSLDLTKYGIDDGMFGYLKIPKLKIILGIYLGATSTNMSKGAVHLTQTSLPIGGINTNAVIAGHRGSRYGKMFLNINKLKIGDKVMITNAWETITYKVTSTAIIAPNEINKVLIQEGRDMVTLISCNPYGKNIQRYVVYCDRVTQN